MRLCDTMTPFSPGPVYYGFEMMADLYYSIKNQLKDMLGHYVLVILPYFGSGIFVLANLICDSKDYLPSEKKIFIFRSVFWK